MTLNGTTYYYVTNLQGDVTALTDSSGNIVVEYVYDSWGKLISTTGSLADTVGVKNPYRYRSYRYDSETGLYYLQSRYYAPEMKRFINADIYVDTGDTTLSTNMFAYCENDAINGIDILGYKYDRVKAVKYALDWYNKKNKQFYYYSSGDCTNFISQCLYAGGIPMTEKWHSYRNEKYNWLKGIFSYKYGYKWDISSSWRLVKSNFNYFVSSKYVKYRTQITKNSDVSAIIKTYNIQIGDLLYFCKSGNTMYHAAIIFKIDNTIFYSAHTDSYDYRNINKFFKTFPNGKIIILVMR